MKKTDRQLDAEIAESLRKGLKPKRARKPKSPEEIKWRRLETLRGIMEDAHTDKAWRDTDLDKLESWIDVDADLSDREWLAIAKNQLIDQSVLPEHAGAAPANVYLWNDVFISTYRMNIDEGMSRQDAIDSARQNANDTIRLTAREHGLENADPKLYGAA